MVVLVARGIHIDTGRLAESWRIGERSEEVPVTARPSPVRDGTEPVQAIFGTFAGESLGASTHRRGHDPSNAIPLCRS